uniref:Uncharacterized protein n=2 Tax=Enterobacterales TaxID=91347 RepID=A0A024HVR5_KLEPN|nr:hypothetical protein PENVA_0140 [Klebsiella pneumoniae]
MFRWKMKFSVKSMKTLLASHGKKMKLTGSFKNGDRFYAVTGWSGEYTIKGIAWQLGLV